jgi:hypothetical protein
VPDIPVPPEAVTAAALVLADVEGDDTTYRDLADDVLRDATPLIVAAERERILALLEAWTCPCGEDGCSAYDTRDQIASLIGDPDA